MNLRTKSPRYWASVLALVLLVTFVVVIISPGRSTLSLTEFFNALFLRLPAQDGAYSILWDLRLPRAISCVLVGAILGICGCAFQLLFRNPLAEPFVVGVSGGAALLGALGFSVGLTTGIALELGQILTCVIGGCLALMVVLGLNRQSDRASKDNLILTGVVVGTVLSSLLTLNIYLRGLNSVQVIGWLMGSISPAFWSRNLVLALLLAAGFWVIMRESRNINTLAMGDLSAVSLGVDPNGVRARILLTGSILASATVGAAGIIAFLGLISPHFARSLVGPNSRQSVPISALIGAICLLFADFLSQRLIEGQEIPVGAITAILGAPMLYFILKNRR
ncbi:MAG: iron ABC transporter permease [Armatimonadetes bacterium]|nr:iron ABC transporter permease [Armatimonadota bacterium]